jgi:hypothetical protein
MASICTATPPPATLPSRRAGLDRRSLGIGNSADGAVCQLLCPDTYLRLVIAAVFIVLLLIGEAALFAHAVKTMPDFLSQADVQVP